jgi:hypothetical protein
VILGELADRADATPDGDLRDTLEALALAAQLDRLVGAAPELEPPFDKERFQAFLREVLAGWILGQAQAIQRLAERGSRLSGYGKGIVAVHAGLADMRFVAAVRAVPLPSDLDADEELRDAYFGSLDQALEPRKARGRDAALVGLRVMAEVGVLADARVDRARALLSEVYAGRRIDALDGLLLPALPAVDLGTPARVLAAHLPTFYVERVLPGLDAGDPSLLRALLERGLPATARAAADASSLRPEARCCWGRPSCGAGSGTGARRTSWPRSASSLRSNVPVARRRTRGCSRRYPARWAGVRGDAAEMMSRGPFPDGPRTSRRSTRSPEAAASRPRARASTPR